MPASRDKKIIILFVLSIAGFLFSGYLSAVKFFSSACALNESCPFFLGYPACYYGFAMFVTLALFSSLLLFARIKQSAGLMAVGGVSLLGIIFSGSFTLKELPIMFEQGLRAYALGLPTCALGLIFYILIFATAVLASCKKETRLNV